MALGALLAGLAVGVDMLAVPIAALALTLLEPPSRTSATSPAGFEPGPPGSRSSSREVLPRALLAGALALAVLHLPVREYPRDYYFAPIAAKSPQEQR